MHSDLVYLLDAPKVVAVLCRLTSRGRCRAGTREPEKPTSMADVFLPISDFGFSVFLSGSKHFTVANTLSCILSIFRKCLGSTAPARRGLFFHVRTCLIW